MADYLARIREAVGSGELKAELVEHPSIDGTKSEDAARAAGVPLDRILKALLLVPRKGTGTPVVAILLGDSRLDDKKLPTHRLASREELKGLLGADFGEAPPVFLPFPVLVDGKVMKKALVVGSAGSRFAGLRLAPSELFKHNKPAKMVDIST